MAAAARPPSITRRSFPDGRPCTDQAGGDQTGGRHAYFNRDPQYFTFPSCTLTHPKAGADGIPGHIAIHEHQDKHDIVFSGGPNLNMIVFEILIKLFDFAHDHIKHPERIKDIDGLFDYYVTEYHGSTGYISPDQKGKKSKKDQTVGRIFGGDFTPEKYDLNNERKLATSVEKTPASSGNTDETETVETDASVGEKTDETYKTHEETDKKSIEEIDEETESDPDVQGEDMLTIKNKMKEVISDFLTEIISFTTPELINEVNTMKKITKAEPMEDKTTETDNIVYDNNVTLLCCFIIVTNNLFSLSTGFSTNNYLTNIYPNRISKKSDDEIIENDIDINNDNDWLTLNHDELNEENIPIKKMKLLIIKTLINVFDTYQIWFDVKKITILELFSRENFDNFFEMYLQNYITNCKKPNVDMPYNRDVPMVGGINDNILKVLDIVRTRKDITKYLNNQIFRVLVCNLLTSLGIITNEPVPGAAAGNDITVFRYTDFGTAITNEEYNATNYNLQHTIKNLLPNNVNPPVHPTLDFLRYQLRTLASVFNNPAYSAIGVGNNFHDYASKEHEMDATMHSIAESNSMIGPVNPAIQKSNVACCPHAHIVSNASTTLGLGTPMDLNRKYQQSQHSIHNPQLLSMPAPGDANNPDPNISYEEMGRLQIISGMVTRKDCVIQTYAGILDPAGTSSIKFDKPYEYGNMDSFVHGNGYDGRPDGHVRFNGKITLINEPTKDLPQQKQSKQQSKKPQKIACRLTNGSINHIALEDLQPIRVTCNVNIKYNECQNYDIGFNNNSSIQKSQGEIPQGAGTTERGGVPVGPTLDHIRQNMLHTLVHDIVRLPQRRDVDQDNLFLDYYNHDALIADPDKKELPDDYVPDDDPIPPILQRGSHITRLFASTLNKTVGDLMQILTVLTKYGGITHLHAIHHKVIPYIYDETYQGHAYREIVHHDLTASIITYFMLIFGSNVWCVTSQDYMMMPFNNGGMNVGACMSDHNNPRSFIGNPRKISDLINYFNNNFMKKCGNIGTLSRTKIEVYVDLFQSVSDDVDNPERMTRVNKLKTANRNYFTQLIINLNFKSVNDMVRKLVIVLSETSRETSKPLKILMKRILNAINNCIKNCNRVFHISVNAQHDVASFAQYAEFEFTTAFGHYEQFVQLSRSFENDELRHVVDAFESILITLQDLVSNAKKISVEEMAVADTMADNVTLVEDWNEVLTVSRGDDLGHILSLRGTSNSKRGHNEMVMSETETSIRNLLTTHFELNDDEINILSLHRPGLLDNDGFLNHMNELINAKDPNAISIILEAFDYNKLSVDDANMSLKEFINTRLRTRGGRKTIRRRNKIAKFTIREKKDYASKSRKYYRKKHKTRSLNSA